MENVKTDKAETVSEKYSISSFYGNWPMLMGFIIAALCAKELGGMLLMGLVIGCSLVFIGVCDTIVKAINKKEAKE